MIRAEAFLAPAKARGLEFFTGVPCSFLTPVINRVISDRETRYVGAASEGEAVGIAAGAWLAGRGTVVMMQNSGLGNAVNPLTSLSYPFRIPTLLVVTWRGGPGVDDEPQHQLMGRITPRLLEVIGVAHRPFPADPGAVEAALAEAAEHMEETGLPYALVVQKGDVAEEPLEAPAATPRPRGEKRDLRTAGPAVARAAALERVLETLPERAAVVATTGKCGRELFTLADRPQHLYQVGSMGCASGMGLGIALHCRRPVIVLDGDGAALMKLGTLATIGANAPENLVHVVLDNAVHDSTGGQPTVSPCVDFAGLAADCAYRRAWTCDDLAGFAEALRGALAEPGPHLVHMRIAPGSMANLGRPTIRPDEVARRFRAFLADDEDTRSTCGGAA